jgi:hypothetical protein
MPGVSGVTVVTTLVCSFYFACEAAGASCARHSPRPLSSGRKFHARLGRIALRECGVVAHRTPLPPRALARGGEGSGVGGGGWGVYQLAPLAANLLRHPPPPTPKSELRSSRPRRFAGGGEQRGNDATPPSSSNARADGRSRAPPNPGRSRRCRGGSRGYA